MRYITPSILFVLPVLVLAGYFILRSCLAARTAHSIPAGTDWVRQTAPARLTFAGKCHPMEKRDRLPILLLTLIYALTAFFQLGDMTSPKTWADLSLRIPVTVELEEGPVRVSGFRYYSDLGTGSYNIEISKDGLSWSTLWQRHEDESNKNSVTSYYFADAEGYSPNYALTQNYNQLFKWIDVTVENPQDVKYIRITGKPDKSDLRLARLCLLDSGGQPVDVTAKPLEGEVLPAGMEELFRVDELVPDQSTWHNSTYFDEIYHARTAKEHIDGIYPYEVTHPPLGKLIIGLGIRLFGMTPFGWRFSGTLFGALMIPLLYLFLKNMFGKTVVATCGTALFAAEFMHLTQTRIATIDTYAVFFILAMYFFMYRYLTLPAGTPFRKGVLPLFLSGLMWGLGAASKWTVFYAGVGLAVVYFMGFYQKLRDWPAEEAGEKASWVISTLLFSVLCFILIPFAIYCAAYIPYAKALGVELFAPSEQNGLVMLFQNVWGKFTDGEGFVAQSIPRDNLLNIMANNQWYMFTYHNGVTSAHPYSSWWFQWIVDGRPILYYMDNTVAGYTTRFAAFSNPVICWTGLGAILLCAAHSFRRTWAKGAFLCALGLFSAFMVYKVQHTPNGVFDLEQLSEGQIRTHLALLAFFLFLYLGFSFFLLLFPSGCDGRAAFLLVGYLAQLVPWMFVGRTTFEYHYFPSILFLVLALSYLINLLVEHDPNWKGPVYALTGTAVGLYVLFYPVLIGLRIPTWYEPVVKWIESWPF